MTSLSEELPKILSELLFSGFFSLIAIWIGARRGFFSLPKPIFQPKNPPKLLLLILAFGIYLLVAIYGQKYLSLIISPWQLSLMLFVSNLLILAALFLFLCTLYAPIRQEILLKQRVFQPKKDLLLALGAYCIVLPIITFSSNTLEAIVQFLFHPPMLPDENAVLFFKSTVGKPLSLVLAIVMISLIAPLIEELLFRGFLQSYIRRFFTPYAAIAISSACFALFHFSPFQGLANIPILGSIFILGCFLGFLYERQGSLFSPFCLHAIFNIFSVAGIYFLKE